MIRYIEATYLGRPAEILPPWLSPISDSIIRRRPICSAMSPTYALWAQSSDGLEGVCAWRCWCSRVSVVTEDTKVFDAVIAAFEKRGVGIGVPFAVLQ